MKTILAAAAATALMASAATAATVSVDFVALEADIGEQGIEGQTFGFGGLGVTVTSTHDAYIDGPTSFRPAGLGVCSSGLDIAGQCIVGGDDDVEVDEAVTLTFSRDVLSMTDFVFRDANHFVISDSADAIEVSVVDADGMRDVSGTFGGVADRLAMDGVSPFASITFAFGGTSYYLSSFTAEVAAVPLPASVLLMGGALGGLGLMRRRAKA